MYRYALVSKDTYNNTWETFLGFDRLLTQEEWHALITEAVAAVGPVDLLIADYLEINHGFALTDSMTAMSLWAGRSIEITVDMDCMAPIYEVEPLIHYQLRPTGSLLIAHPLRAPWGALVPA